MQNAVIYYDETFSPVARYDTLRGVLAVAVLERLKLHQFDMKTAFLCSTVQKAVHVRQPEGFDDGSGRVCKIKRSLYGLKQAPRCWNKRFVDSMKDQKLEVSTAGPCLLLRQRNCKKLIVAINVEEELIAGSEESEIDVFIDQLHRKITTGTLSYFLEMPTEQRKDGIFV